MKIGIIGSGNIGGTAARLFAAAGHEVALSHRSGPESLREQVAQLGEKACAMTVDEAAEFGDVVLLALPWRAREDLPAPRLAGRIAIDATNPYRSDFSLYDLGDSTSSEEMQRTIPGARLVKAFNTLFAKDLASRGRRRAGTLAGLAHTARSDEDWSCARAPLPSPYSSRSHAGPSPPAPRRPPRARPRSRTRCSPLTTPSARRRRRRRPLAEAHGNGAALRS